jgi:DNA repair exonuclease SbcCD ATPase subunit
MARITCPNCGAERIVMAGKRKRCRKCNTWLTSTTVKQKPSAPEVPLTEHEALTDELHNQRNQNTELRQKLRELEAGNAELLSQLEADGEAESSSETAAETGDASGEELQAELEELTLKYLKVNGKPRANAPKKYLDRISELKTLLAPDTAPAESD